MNIEQQSIRERPRLQIDERLGFILAVVAGALSSIAAGGWMILLSDITQLKSTFEAGEAQRFVKLGQVEGVIRTIQDKIETLTGANGKLRMLEDKLDFATGKFLQVEATIKLNSDGIARNNIRLDKLEEELSKGIVEPRRHTLASKRPMGGTREAR